MAVPSRHPPVPERERTGRPDRTAMSSPVCRKWRQDRKCPPTSRILFQPGGSGSARRDCTEVRELQGQGMGRRNLVPVNRQATICRESLTRVGPESPRIFSPAPCLHRRGGGGVTPGSCRNVGDWRPGGRLAPIPICMAAMHACALSRVRCSGRTLPVRAPRASHALFGRFLPRLQAAARRLFLSAVRGGARGRLTRRAPFLWSLPGPPGMRQVPGRWRGSARTVPSAGRSLALAAGHVHEPTPARSGLRAAFW